MCASKYNCECGIPSPSPRYKQSMWIETSPQGSSLQVRARPTREVAMKLLGRKCELFSLHNNNARSGNHGRKYIKSRSGRLRTNASRPQKNRNSFQIRNPVSQIDQNGENWFWRDICADNGFPTPIRRPLDVKYVSSCTADSTVSKSIFRIKNL